MIQKYSTRPKRGPIEAQVESCKATLRNRYSTRPKRGPIEALRILVICLDTLWVFHAS